MDLSLDDLLQGAKRELMLRRRSYPNWVRNGKMAGPQAAKEIAIMEGIVAQLSRLKTLEEISSEMLNRRTTQPDLGL